MSLVTYSKKQPAYSKRQQAAAIIKALANNRSPEQYAFRHLFILDKRKTLIPFAWNSTQRHFHANRTGHDLVLKARQLGFSTYIQGEIFRRLTTKTSTTMTMAHDSDTTQKLRRMADRFWEHCKYYGVQPIRRYSNAALATYPDYDSTSIIATAGNVDTGRGDTYTDLHGSEVAFWPDAERILAGAMQGGNPDVVLESTPNGAQGFFYERCMEALDGGSIWKLHFYPWWWDVAYRIALQPGETLTFTDEEAKLIAMHGLDALQIKWRRQKQNELKRLFFQEYPEDPITCFLTSGASYFGDLSNSFTAPATTIYHKDHIYQAGLDWGQENDYTVLIIIDLKAKVMVDKLRVNNLEWKEIRRRVKEMCDKWHVSGLIAEANSIGSVNIEALRNLGLGVQPFDTTNLSKATIMSDLYEALHTDGLKLMDWDVLKHELKIFTSTQLPSGIWRLAATGTGHDDTVIALALAVQPQMWTVY